MTDLFQLHQESFRFHPSADDAPTIPARMVNEYVYCPRLALPRVGTERVGRQRRDRAGADTSTGESDKRRGPLPTPEHIDDEIKLHARSVTLESERLRVVAKLDLIESEDGFVVPVDYKRGNRPHVAKGAYDPERVQLCAQGLILEDHGYSVREGVIYFAGSKERVRVSFDGELRSLTLDSIEGLRAVGN